MTILIEKNGIQYIKNLFRESYQEKRIAFENFLKSKKKNTIEKFVKNIFKNQCFIDSDISKAEFILQLLIDEIRLDFWIFLRTKMQNLGYLADRRHSEEYAFDIVLGWLSEEMIMNEIKSQASIELPINTKFETKFIGIDSDREFQSLNIRAKADFYIKTNNKIIKIDLFVDYKNTWQKNGYFDIKKGKIDHFEKNELDYVLALDIVNQNLYLISKFDVLGFELTPNPAMGNVKTAQIPLTNPIELPEILNHLLK